MRFFGILFVVFLFNSNCLYAQDEVDKDMFEQAEAFAKCSGLLDANSDVLEVLGKPHAAQTYADTARGAYLSAALLANMYGYAKDFEKAQSWAKNKSEINKNLWLGSYELEPENLNSKEFKEQMSICAEMLPLQEELMNYLRTLTYSE